MKQVRRPVTPRARSAPSGRGRPLLRRFRIIVEPPLADASADPEEALLICPWLRGLEPEAGLFLSALPIHDSNGFVDDDRSLALPAALRRRCYVGVFALDRLRRTEQLFARLRDKGVENLINLPSVSFFDDATARTFATLGFTPDAEIAFLAQARRGGFGVALCARVGAITPDAAALFDFVLWHQGPDQPLNLEVASVDIA